jgi:hypothetical protein
VDAARVEQGDQGHVPTGDHHPWGEPHEAQAHHRTRRCREAPRPLAGRMGRGRRRGRRRSAPLARITRRPDTGAPRRAGAARSLPGAAHVDRRRMGTDQP